MLNFKFFIMKTRKHILLFFVPAFIILFFSGCKKYEEGGLVSKTEKNLIKDWSLSKYLKNDIDETSSILITNYEESYSESGIYSRSFNDKDDEFESQSGTWEFDKENLLLNISGVGSIEISEDDGTISSSTYYIIKLEKEEFWYYYENGGEKHEFHFTSK